MGKARFKRREPVIDGTRRVARGLLDQAEAVIVELPPDDPDRVHEARKLLNETRGLLRLVRGSLGEEAFQRENVALRDARKLLDTSRDATVRSETFEKLVRNLKDKQRREVNGVAELLEERDEDARPSENGEAEREFLEVVDGVRTRTESWSLDDRGFDALEGGFRRTFRRARQGYVRAQDDHSAEVLHEWRKRCKYLRSFVRLMIKSDPKKAKKLERRLDDLCETLGEDRDLILLERWLKEHAEPPRALLDLMTKRQKKLRKRAMKLGGKLFDRKAKKTARKVRGWWEDWRG